MGMHDIESGLSELERYICNPEDIMSCSIVQSIGGKHCNETLFYVASLVRFLEKYTGIFFEEMAADFIKYRNAFNIQR